MSFKKPSGNTCQICYNQYSTKCELVEHLKDQHSNDIFHCDVCNQYLSQTILTEHMTDHARVISNKEKQHSTKAKSKSSIRPSVQCEYCNKILSYVGYSYHIKVVHNGLRQFKCSECAKMFSSKRVLNNHINSHHTKDRSFQCTVCAKSFTTDSGLYNHKRIHEIDFKFTCDTCDKPFKFRAQLNKHSMIHQDDLLKPKWLCNLCGKPFSVKSNLAIHMKTHTDFYGFECLICGFLTKQKRYLAEHIKRLHQETTTDN